mgnify:CR=1 FL=1
MQSFSDHLYTWNDETVDSALKNASLELNMIDFGKIFEDHLYMRIRENMISFSDIEINLHPLFEICVQINSTKDKTARS